jgi:hypothetical protein
MDGIDQRRDDAGQFTSAEPLVGQDATLADDGYVTLPKQSSDELDARSAADQLAERRGGPEIVEPLPIKSTLGGELTEKLEENDPEGRKLAFRNEEEAAQALSAYREAEATGNEALDDAQFLDEIGLDPTPPQLEQPAETSDQNTTEQQPQKAEDPKAEKLSKYLEDPDFQELFLEQHGQASQKIAQAEQVRAQYAQGLDQAVALAEIALLQQFPELANVRTADQLNGAFQAIATQNPQRAQQIQGRLMEAGRLVQAQRAEHARAQQLAAQREAESFKSYAAEQGRTFDQKYGPATDDDVKAVRSYVQELGLSDSDLAALQTDRTARDHRFQKVLLDAAKYHALQRAPARAAPKTLPPVQRPGVSQPRSVRGAESLSTLNSRLNASGNLDDAVKLLQAKRSARG